MTKTQERALRAVAWGTEHFGSLATGRVTRKRTVQALLRKGLVADAGMVAMCDGDGFLLQSERYGQGWKITDAGKEALDRVDDAANKHNEKRDGHVSSV